MNIAPHRLRARRISRSPRSRRQRAAAASLASGVAVTAAAAVVFGVVLGPGRASSAPLLAGFGARSYAPGQVAVLAIAGGDTNRATLQIFQAGTAGTPGPSAVAGWDKPTFGKPVTAPQPVRRPSGNRRWVVHIRLGSTWASGDYVARLTWGAHTDYAPFVLRPGRLGTSPVLVVEPTNTWHAYDVVDGDSWYLDSSVHVIDLTHPFASSRVSGAPVPAGLPQQFSRYDLGFLRWYWHSGYRADFISDDDLERISSASQLSRYRLIVFAGHEEYVTSHTFDVITRYRNAGGNLAFLSANNFFYKVSVTGNTMSGRTPWRNLGRPEAALVGAQYAGWDEGHYPNRPYRIVNTAAAPWLFRGTGLHDGSVVGNYGIEVDEPNAASPPHTHVLAEIPNELGPGKPAEMTIYTRGGSTVFDAGTINFGASAHWPALSQFFANLWSHLSGESTDN
ncbi:MAG TPA: N,N-dimethylformamidase beta subunit family domain-containing protein [Gaiellaceae bacterium]|nr:N,N-dimethylformamidase beta subunit family domain-containing protein [Gaiellaceae bacterium]